MVLTDTKAGINRLHVSENILTTTTPILNEDDQETDFVLTPTSTDKLLLSEEKHIFTDTKNPDEE